MYKEMHAFEILLGEREEFLDPKEMERLSSHDIITRRSFYFFFFILLFPPSSWKEDAFFKVDLVESINETFSLNHG